MEDKERLKLPWMYQETDWACSRNCSTTLKLSRFSDNSLEDYLRKNSVPKIAVDFLGLKRRFPGIKIKQKRA